MAAVVAGLLLAVVITAATMRADPPPYMGVRANLGDSQPTSIAGTTRMTDGLRYFSESVWIDDRDVGLVVDVTPVTCHGGRARIEWFIGNLEPQTRDTGLHLNVRLDGSVVATILRGTTVDTLGDHPVSSLAVVECPEGEHVVDLKVRLVGGRWGFPYVANEYEPPVGDLRVARGFVISEVYAPPR
jgi:hypothetical protein